jgi:ankyrin repeat protein
MTDTIKDIQLRTPFMNACKAGDVILVVTLIKDVDLFETDVHGNTALMIAVIHKQKKVIETMLNLTNNDLLIYHKNIHGADAIQLAYYQTKEIKAEPVSREIYDILRSV